jgi:hypothetical protein
VRLSVPLEKSNGVMRAAAVLGDQITVETELPHGVSAVLVQGAALGDLATERGLVVGIDGGTLGEPLLFDAERQAAALYPVRANGPFRITAGQQGPFRVTGVLGVRGHVAEVAAALHGRPFDGLVPDGPLSASGAVRITFEGGRQ